MTKESVVTGEIVFAKGAKPFSGAVVTVRLTDVSMADAPAGPIAEQVIRDVSFDEKTRIPFRLQGSANSDRGRYTVSAHVSLNGSRDIQQGDYITMQSYPVLTFGAPDRVTVEVRPVG